MHLSLELIDIKVVRSLICVCQCRSLHRNSRSFRLLVTGRCVTPRPPARLDRITEPWKSRGASDGCDKI